MPTINSTKIGSVASLAAGATHNFQWNNPPWGTVLGYFAYPVPPTVSGSHGSASGTVQITKVECTWLRDNYNGEKKHVNIEVKNTGSGPTGFDVFESWIG